VDEAVNIAEGELLMSKTMGVSPWFFILWPNPVVLKK
jgi:hypothetical protein